MSGSLYTCTGDGRVTLASGDIVTSNSGATIYANNGFSLGSNTTVGSASNNINLTSNYGTITSSGTSTVNGTVNAGSGIVTLSNTTINGSLTSTGNINLTGGSVSGLVTSSSNTITTNGTNLGGGATAQSGMTITGGTISGNFNMTAYNAATFSGVTMTSGNISGASIVTIQSGSVLGSTSSVISISSNSGAITVNNSTVYGNLTAPSYSTVNVSNGASVIGTCTPGSTPANACGGAPPAVCPAGVSSGITGYYYNNTTLAEPATATRTDAPINFNWGAAAPGPAGIGVDNFSVRWSGYVRATTSGVYRFQTVSDDGVRLYVNGDLVIDRWNAHSSTTDTTGDIALVAGQSYSIVLEYYEGGGDAEIRLLWRLPGASSFVAIPGGPTPTLGAGLYQCIPVAKPPISSCATSLSAGITGNYFSNRTLTSPVTAYRSDGPINFDWGTGVPGPTGITADNFSVRWTGYVRATQSGVHRFQVTSDDGVRLTVNGDLLIDQWNDHSSTTYTTAAVNLEAGNNYPIVLEYYENAGSAVMQLRWQTPSTSSFVDIPKGSSPVASAGLYECVATPGSYLISHNANGITCAAEAVTVTARNTANVVYSPPAGTVVTLTTNPATGVWVGGNSYTFTGTESSFTKYLQQTTPAALYVTATSATASTTNTSAITFLDTILKVAYTATNDTIPTQIAAVNGSAMLRVLSTNPKTGVCEARLGSGAKTVSLGYTCVNPTTCVAGQTFTVNSTSIAANNNAAPVNYSNVNVTFDSSGNAPITINYSDVGMVLLSGRLTIPASGNDPAVTISGSNNFVVKPYTLVVTNAAQTASPFTVNPGTTSIGSGFIPAGEKFNVTMLSRNALGALTPNFGNEISDTERKKLQLSMGCPERTTVHDATATCSASRPEYPASASMWPLTVGEDLNNDGLIDPPTAVSGGGILPVVWEEVGSFRFHTSLSGTGYLGTGSVDKLTPSGIIGRFYPDHFLVNPSVLTDACTSFSYMEQPLPLSYTVEARGLYSRKLQNYGPAYGTMPTLAYVAESQDSGINIGARVQDGVTKVWNSGSAVVAPTNAVFLRSAVSPFIDGPHENTLVGLKLTDNFDSRSLKNMDMNATTKGVCAAASCDAKVLGSAINLRYGRMRLDDAFGSESAVLPVNFYTEFWNGNRFVRSANDNCTRVLRGAITYPGGNIFTAANLTVGLNGGSTTGNYASMTANEVIFGSGSAGQHFSAPTGGATGEFTITVNLTNYPWLRFDWNQVDGVPDNTNCSLAASNASRSSDCDIRAQISFGGFRGHDRVIYWRERFNLN